MINDSKINICFRCNAGHSSGYGHVTRCLALGIKLKELRSANIVFVLDRHDASKRVSEIGFSVKILNNDADVGFTILMEHLRPDILVMDARPPHSMHVMRKIREIIPIMVMLDSTHEQYRLMDAVYLSPVAAPIVKAWHDFQGVVRGGFDWALSGIETMLPDFRQPSPPYKLLMTVGASDPWGYTRRLVPVFAQACSQAGIQFGVVVGPCFTERNAFIRLLRQEFPEVILFDQPKCMYTAYQWCDGAVTTPSVSAYELARMGKPALYICPDEKYEDHARIFERCQAGCILVTGQCQLTDLSTRLQDFKKKIMDVESMRKCVVRYFSQDPAKCIASDILALYAKNAR